MQVLAVGEVMALIAPANPELLEDARELVLDIGGAEANVASHLAARKIAAGWAGAVGDDPLGRRILRTLVARGVDVRHVRVDPDAPTGLYLKSPAPTGTSMLYYRRGSAASRLDASFADTLPLDEVPIVVTSGITPALSDGCDDLTERVLRTRAAAHLPVVFDVNYRPALWPSVEVAAWRLLDLAQHASTVFVGRDEAETLWNTATPRSIRTLLPQGRLVVKDSGFGATAFDDSGGEVFVHARPIEVLEPVGAGDAFAGAFIAADFAGAGTAESLTAGHDAAARQLLTLLDS